MNLGKIERFIDAMEAQAPDRESITLIRIAIMRPGPNGPEETGEVIERKVMR